MRGMLGAVALAAVAAAGPAGAEIALFGDARLGFGYNVFNNGVVNLEPARTQDGLATRLEPADEARALSRVRFGVRMTGTSDAGVGFGATIRADNSGNGQGGTRGQRAGNVFVTGAWGTLTFGDTPGGDQRRVGAGLGNQSLTGLGDFDQPPFLSNGGGSDNDTLEFLADPDDRPTLRYDYDVGGFGLSVSANRDLDAIAGGLGYLARFGEEATLALGIGYYDFAAFEGQIAGWGDIPVPAGEQWSAGLVGRAGGLAASLVYAAIDAGGSGELDVLAIGAGLERGDWRLRAYYSSILEGAGDFGAAFDGRDSYGASLGLDLGGGATLAMGVARSYGADAVGEPGAARFLPAAARATVADLGVRMNF